MKMESKLLFSPPTLILTYFSVLFIIVSNVFYLICLCITINLYIYIYRTCEAILSDETHCKFPVRLVDVFWKLSCL